MFFLQLLLSGPGHHMVCTAHSLPRQRNVCLKKKLKSPTLAGQFYLCVYLHPDNTGIRGILTRYKTIAEMRIIQILFYRSGIQSGSLLHSGTGHEAAWICCQPKLWAEGGFMRDNNAVFRVKVCPVPLSPCCPGQNCTTIPICSASPHAATTGWRGCEDFSQTGGS